jgi:pilin isopeptide linkage protein
MNTNLLKKGRSAVAILLSVALVLTTATFPVSIAKAVDEPQVMPIVTELGEKMEPSSKLEQHYNLPEGHNFVYIKQGHDTNVLWTVDDFESIWGPTIDIGTADVPGPDREAFMEFLGDQLNPSSDLSDPSIEYIHGFGEFVFNEDEPGEFTYEFTLDETDDHISFLYLGDKVSHFYTGMYKIPTDTVSLIFTKELVGMDLEADMFDFTLSEASETWVEGTVLQTISNTDSLNNNVVFNDLVFDEEGVFHFIIKELSADPMDDVTYDDHIVKLTVTVEEIDEGVFDAVAVFDGDMVFTNTYEEEELGQISVTKEVEVTDDSETLVNGTFYAGLFTMVEDEYVLVQIGDEDAIAELKVENSAPVTDDTTFTNLELDKMYYIFETDEDGVIIETDPDGNILPLRTSGWYALEYDGNEVALDPQNMTGEATITNYFSSDEGGLTGSIKVVKTVTVNKKPFASNLTFHVGLFEDEELTMLIETKDLVMNGKTETSVSFDELEAGLYYIAETDKDGKPLTGTAKELGFEIQINGEETNNVAVELIEDEMLVNLVNNFKKEEFPLTGDNSNMNFWLFLAMLGVAGAIAPFAFGKKEVTND